MWDPISLNELTDKISAEEPALSGEVRVFWEKYKIEPEKWQEEEYGNEGGGFWVVAVCPEQVIWYNDIEEGFNVSCYCNYGYIDEYMCNQDYLFMAIRNCLAYQKWRYNLM